MVIRDALLIVLLLASSASAQGVVLSMRQTRGDQAATTVMQLDSTHVRADLGRGSNGAVVVFDGTAQVLRMIDSERKSYREVTRAQTAQVGALLAAVQAQLEKFPPEQRKAMEAMLRGRAGMLAGGPALAPISYARTGPSKVGAWGCVLYDGLRDGQKVVEICAADGAEFGLTAADFQGVRQLVEFVKVLVPLAADEIAVYGSLEEQGFAGFPVRRTTLVNGMPDTVTELVDLRRESIPASAFEVPAAFTREELFPNMRR